MRNKTNDHTKHHVEDVLILDAISITWNSLDCHRGVESVANAWNGAIVRGVVEKTG